MVELLRVLLAAFIDALLAAGYDIGRVSVSEVVRASIWGDPYKYDTATEYFSGGGSYTALTAVVADWDH